MSRLSAALSPSIPVADGAEYVTLPAFRHVGDASRGSRLAVAYTVWVVAFNAAGMPAPPSAEAERRRVGIRRRSRPAPRRRYFAEGAAGFFSYRLALLNTTSTEHGRQRAFLREGAPPVIADYTCSPQRRATISASDVPELTGCLVSPPSSRPRPAWWRSARCAGRLHGLPTARTSARALPDAIDAMVSRRRGRRLLRHLRAVREPWRGGGSGHGRTSCSMAAGGRSVPSRWPRPSGYTIWTNAIPELHRAIRSRRRCARPSRRWSSGRCTSAGPNGGWEGGHASAAVTARSLAAGSSPRAAPGDFFETFVPDQQPQCVRGHGHDPVSARPSGVARTETRTPAAIQPHDDSGRRAAGSRATPTSPVPSPQRRDHRRAVDVLAWPAGPWYSGAQQRRHAGPGNPLGARGRRGGGEDGAETFVLLANPGARRRGGHAHVPTDVGRPVAMHAHRSAAIARHRGGLVDWASASGERFGVVDRLEPAHRRRAIDLLELPRRGLDQRDERNRHCSTLTRLGARD